MTTSNVDIVEQFFAAYLSQDLGVATALAAADLVFTSPQDDHIDRTTYFDKCFPTASRLKSQQIQRIAAAGSDDVFVMYEYVLLTGERHRNAELITVRDGQIAEVQVFFGAPVD